MKCFRYAITILLCLVCVSLSLCFAVSIIFHMQMKWFFGFFSIVGKKSNKSSTAPKQPHTMTYSHLLHSLHIESILVYDWLSHTCTLFHRTLQLDFKYSQLNLADSFQFCENWMHNSSSLGVAICFLFLCLPSSLSHPFASCFSLSLSFCPSPPTSLLSPLRCALI